MNTQDKPPIIELCPVCGADHVINLNERQITCECGMILEISVPIFRRSESGYVWRIIGSVCAVDPELYRNSRVELS